MVRGVQAETIKKLNSSQDVEGTEFLMAWLQSRTESRKGDHYRKTFW